MTLAELQTAFYEMMTVIDAYRDGWIISVFENNDPRVHGSEWVADYTDIPPIILMSDELYSMYAADVGIKNENMKR